MIVQIGEKMEYITLQELAQQEEANAETAEVKQEPFTLKLSPEKMPDAFAIMSKGMLGIFISIGAIMLIIYLMGIFTKKKKK